MSISPIVCGGRCRVVVEPPTLGPIGWSGLTPSRSVPGEPGGKGETGIGSVCGCSMAQHTEDSGSLGTAKPASWHPLTTELVRIAVAAVAHRPPIGTVSPDRTARWSVESSLRPFFLIRSLSQCGGDDEKLPPLSPV